MKRPAKKQGEDADVIDGPAVVGKDHVRDRVLSPAAGAKAACSRR